MTRFLKLLLAFLLGLTLAGCMEVDEVINIKEDGSATARYTIAVDPQYAAMVVPALKKGMPNNIALVEEKVVNGRPTLIFNESAANVSSLRGSQDVRFKWTKMPMLPAAGQLQIYGFTAVQEKTLELPIPYKTTFNLPGKISETTGKKLASNSVEWDRTGLRAGMVFSAWTHVSTGFNLSRLTEPFADGLDRLLYKQVTLSKRDDILWVKEGNNAEKHLTKPDQGSVEKVISVGAGGQILYTQGNDGTDKTYFRAGIDVQPREIDLSFFSYRPNRSPDGRYAGIFDEAKGSYIVNLFDGTFAAIPSKPVPDPAKAAPNPGVDAKTFQNMLADAANQRPQDGAFLWSESGDEVAFNRCVWICGVYIYDIKTKAMTLAAAPNGKHRDFDDRVFEGPVLFRAGKVYVNEGSELWVNELASAKSTVLVRDVAAPAASLDGSKIAFLNSEKIQSILVLDVPSGRVQKVFSFPNANNYYDVSLSWSDDNRYIYWGAPEQSWKIDLNAKSRRKIPVENDEGGIHSVGFPENFSRELRLPRFGFVSLDTARLVIIGLMALIVALVVFTFFFLGRKLILAAIRTRAARVAALATDAPVPAQTMNEFAFCSECGARYSARAAFCGKCGKKLE